MGFDNLNQRFMDEANALATQPGPLCDGGLNNTHLDFAWNVGLTDVADGAEEVITHHLDLIETLFQGAGGSAARMARHGAVGRRAILACMDGCSVMHGVPAHCEGPQSLHALQPGWVVWPDA